LSVIIGSGIDAPELSSKKEIYFSELGLGVTKVEGHKGKFSYGLLNDQPVLYQHGRLHLYEGFSGVEVASPIRAQMNAGVRSIVITNSAGSIDPNVGVGSLVLVTSLDFTLTPETHPSTGCYGESFGSQFYPVSCTSSLSDRVKADKKGGYVFRYGPNYEDPVDIQSLRLKRRELIKEGLEEIAPLVVGMSTVPEVLAANQFSTLEPVEVTVLSYVTNLCAGLSSVQPSHKEVLENASAGRARINRVLTDLLK
jgi:purine-nucleoside phosphorylase